MKIHFLLNQSFFDFLSHFIPDQLNTVRQYVYVFVLTMFALLARLLIAPLDGGIQYVTFFPAVAISAIIGGFGAGLFSAIIGVVLATYLFWPPYQMWTFEFRYEMIMSNTVFLIDALLVCSAVEAMHRYYGRFVDAEQELRLAASVFHNSDEGILITDARGHIISVNPAFTDITGYAPHEAIGQTPRLLRSHRHEADFYSTMWDTLLRNGVWQGEVWNRRKNGEAYLEWLTINRVGNNKGMPVNYVAVFHDMTELHKNTGQLKHLAYHDALTGLPNRTLFADRLQHAIARAQRDRYRLLVAFIDLDKFKLINDNLGHEIGDLVLQETAKRIKAHLRESDTLARMGGDEFVILLENQESLNNCTVFAETLIAEISCPLHLSGHVVQIGASMGLAYFPDDETEPVALLMQADSAMYAVKKSGRNGYRFFQPRS